MKVNVLMVEDNGDQQTIYCDAVDDFNAEQGTEITISFIDNAKDAIQLLDNEPFDIVLLDLKLKEDPSEGDQASGNKVLRHILNNSQLRLVVYVVSGTLHTLSAEFEDVFENPLMRKFNRDDETDKLLNDLLSVLKTGVTKILGGQGKFEELVNSIFFSHLSKGFEYWVAKDADCEKELLRYTAMHLLEHLEIPEDNSNREITYLNPEFYILPPIKPNVSCGDIVIIDEEKYIILTPSCDIAPRTDGERVIYNVDIVVLARVLPLDKDVFDGLNISYSSKNETSQGKWNSFAEKHRGTSPKNRFHYLPEYLSIGESLIDFKRIMHLPVEKVVTLDGITREATVSNPFIRDIQGRFTSYYGRHGQPRGEWSG